MIKKYLQFIKESDDSLSANDTYKYEEVKKDVESMIQSTIDKTGGEIKSFIESFIKNPDDVKIEGLINDSDIYEFYLKWRNDIDEILNNIKFFGDNPTEVNAFGLYEYTIKGTERAIEEIVKMIK